MAESTGISWTDSTLNLWIGCTKVGPGCDNCYAEAMDHRFGGGHWGPGAQRRRTAPATWNQALKWQREAERTGIRRRVFVNSLSDFWDNEVEGWWRTEGFALFALCPMLDFQLVTKRIGNAVKMCPASDTRFPSNVWQLITVVNQEEADRDIPKLIAFKKTHGLRVAGLSIEPMLGYINLSAYLHQIDWVICGGESGPRARHSHPDMFISLRDQCAEAGVAFFFKQHGEYTADVIGREDPRSISYPPDHVIYTRVGKRAAGDRLHGLQHHNWPA